MILDQSILPRGYIVCRRHTEWSIRGTAGKITLKLAHAQTLQARRFVRALYVTSFVPYWLTFSCGHNLYLTILVDEHMIVNIGCIFQSSEYHKRYKYSD